jgi:hypothetical protein
MTRNEFIEIGSDAQFWSWVHKRSLVPYKPHTLLERKNLLSDVYKKIAKRTYYPSPPKEYVTLNKGKGVVRVIPAFQLEDLIVYYYCIRKLERYLAINRVQSTYGGFALGGKFRRAQEADFKQTQNGLEVIEIGGRQYVFTELPGGSPVLSSLNPKAWQAAWGDFANKLYFHILTFGRGFAAELDISNFYDSIQLDSLEFKVRKYVSHKQSETIYLLFHFLRFWNRHVNFYRQQGAGIPQDAFGECSRILANFYLQSYDKKIYDFCKRRGARYFRYADDQVILAKSKEDLEEIIAKASSFLMRDGLNFNQKKVDIKTIAELNQCFSFENFLKLTVKDGKLPSKTAVRKQISFYFQNKDILRKRGWSLLKRILNVSVQLSEKPQNFDRIKPHVLTKEFLLKSPLTHEDFIQIYRILNKREKVKMVRILNELVESCLHSNYLYEVRAFYKAEKLSIKRVGMRLTYVKHFYAFARTA